jgi:hypothetical protein
MMPVAVLLAAVLLVILLFVVLFRRLAARFDPQACNAEWLESFSLQSYAPMQRLLEPDDFRFLESQPGYRPEIGKELRAERRKMVAGYLRLLTRDFNQLLGIAKLMLVYSTQDRPEFAKDLWRQQIAFYFAVCALRCRLALYPLGWTGTGVRKLVNSLGSLRQQIQGLAPQQAGWN